jgi:tetratricopeptide (TPR) repeat protein
VRSPVKFRVGYRQALLLLLAVAMASCSGGHRKPAVVENPYASRAQDFINNGKFAMQQERWQVAELSFSRALLAAQLADNTALVSQSWYNMGMVRAAMGLQLKAEDAYNKAIRLSGRYRHEVMQMRARLALTLLRLRANKPVSDSMPDDLFSRKNWTADIYLQAARIAQLQKQSEQAKNAYNAVLNLKGKGKAALKMKAEAHMGLALLAKSAGETDEAHLHVDETLALCRRIGAARLTAHALLLKGQLPGGSGTYDIRRDQLERALDIYSVLKDVRGQRQSLKYLDSLAKAVGDRQAMKRIQLRLRELNDKLEQ